MNDNKVKILVACHKPGPVYRDNVYTPIHVGRAISKFGEEMQDMIGDDTGDNISAKNPYYCELTAQYWAWKNLECQYVGLCHYRRYFETKITEDNIETYITKDKDVICIKPSYEYISTSLRLIRATCMEDMQIFMHCLKSLYPEYYPTAKKVLGKGIVVAFNMFVMKKNTFDDFAEWQFSILSEMEKYIRLSGYTRARRLYGYFAEMMLLIYLTHNGFTFKYDNWVNMLGEQSEPLPFKQSIKRFCLKLFNRFVTFPIDIDNDAVIVGFKADGIPIGYLER